MEQWVEDSVAFVPHVDCLPSRAYKRDAKYCSFHCKKEHTLEQRVLFREIFDKKLKTGEFLFKNEGALSIHEIRLPNTHNNRGNGQILVDSTSKRDVEGDVSIAA